MLKLLLPVRSCKGRWPAIEVLVGVGTAVLVLIVMPQFDVLTNLFISHLWRSLHPHRYPADSLPAPSGSLDDSFSPLCSLILVLFGCYTLLAMTTMCG
ncbi:hypothetical protein NFI96_009175 [Prochilodus magdalenae]|nr:hypothetical protein NFI96_009175 [Prochilodus magdalenae]